MPKGQPNKSELTVFFYLFLYRAVNRSLKIYVAF